MFQWQSVGNFNTARWNYGLIGLNDGTLLACGGFTGDYSGSTVTATCEIYTPATGLWTTTGSMNLACANTSLVLLPNGKVLRFGGAIPSGSGSNMADLYDPVAKTWTATGTMNTAREIVGGVLLDSNHVLVIGGYNGAALASCEIYSISGGTWSNTGSLNTARYDIGYTLLNNGKVLAVGGFNNISTAEVYDPVATTWSFTSNNPSAACGNDSISNLVTLASGKILRTGGLFNGGSTTSDCDLYDPSANTWSSTGSLNTSRSGHMTTLMSNGKVLVAGGYSTQPSPIVSTEIYDPTGATWSAGPNLPVAKTYTSGTIGVLANNQPLFAGGLDSSTANATSVILTSSNAQTASTFFVI